MSEFFKINTVWMDHSGGTKFYQLFRIERVYDTLGVSSGRAPRTRQATVGHYGAYKAMPNNGRTERRPISGGQTVVYPGAKYEELYKDKTRERNGGRYVPEKVVKATKSIQGEDDFHTWLRQNLQTLHRDKVLKELGMSLDPSAAPIDPDDEPIAEVETINHDSDDRPEGWGDW